MKTGTYLCKRLFQKFQVLIVEIIRDKKGNGIGEKFLCGSVIPGWLWESYQTIGVFTFGASCQQLTSDLAKNVIGRLRPHFIAVSIIVYLNLFKYIGGYRAAAIASYFIQSSIKDDTNIHKITPVPIGVVRNYRTPPATILAYFSRLVHIHTSDHTRTTTNLTFL